MDIDIIKEFFPPTVQTELIFFVNGKKIVEYHPDPEWTLLWYLRSKLQLTGTKYGCGEGGCGACTVMLSQYIADEDFIKHIAVNACLTPVCSVHGLAITTVEGIGTAIDEKLHPVQERLAKAHGSQCGFCTPGFVMSMYTLLRNKTTINYHDITEALQGNLCRCTGYRPILEAFKTFTDAWQNQYASGKNASCMMGENCCKNKTNEQPSPLFKTSSFKPYDRSQERIFPPELKLNNKKYNNDFLVYCGERVTWIRPTRLTELLKIKSRYPQSKLVVGNTEIGVEINIKKLVYPLLISPNAIPDLSFCRVNENSYEIGATTTLTEVKQFCEEQLVRNPIQGRICNTIGEMLKWFAGNQVRNVASIAGNIVTASPISDLNPILLACSAVLNIYSEEKGRRVIPIDENFFRSYRTTVLQPNEIILSVEFPFTKNNQRIKAYKQARRKDDDISIVTAVFSVEFRENSDIVERARLCFGGMAPTTICALKTSLLIENKSWTTSLLETVFASLTNELQLDISAPGGMPEYRKSLCLSLFFKFFMFVSNKLDKKYYLNADSYEISKFDHKSSQYFEINRDGVQPCDAVGLPIPHASAFKQATGEALYCDDIPHVQGELYLCLVTSKMPHAKIIAIDASKALALPGVKAFFSATDLDKRYNNHGPMVKDEEVFSTTSVTSRACVIGAVVAESVALAARAKTLVEVTYSELKPVIISIEDAIANNSFFHEYSQNIIKGDIKNAFQDADHVIHNQIRTGAQEHFYLESMAAFAVRKEEELEITSSCQNPAEVSQTVSRVLQLPQHKIISKAKRIGGGFGGKETRTLLLAVPVAIAAYKLKRPVRAVLERDEDMQITGYRHPILFKYKVAFNSTGKLLGAIFDIYINAGFSLDITGALVERVVTHIDNSYYIPNVEVNCHVCKTNLPSNTSFRGFGGPQAMLASEDMIRNVANKLDKTYEEIAELNFYQEGDLTHYNQILTHCTLTRCWKECLNLSDYMQRKQLAEEFNRKNRWVKKGISIVPTKYGISFGNDTIMQGGALLLVYTDGSVLLSIGGIEMGQGLYTKMIQVASRVLDIDISKIHISEMSTDKVPNSSQTAASLSSDIYGMAVVNACNIIIDRLKPYKRENPEGKWEDWVSAAYTDRVNLSASGYYAVPKIEYKRETNAGKLYEYYTYGVACSEVMIDCLTGDHKVLRTDIVMDLGESLNPAIDIGQIEGAFMQGYGMFTMEELVFSPSGVLLSCGPGAYKIPTASDIPQEFNVSLLKGAPNPRAVYSSKAVGEPPLFSASSVFFAIKNAVKAARTETNASLDFSFDAPATCAKIRLACADNVTKQVESTIRRDGIPWNVTL